MLMRRAIPTAHSPPFYSTNRLLADGHNIFLQIQEEEDLEAYILVHERALPCLAIFMCHLGECSYRARTSSIACYRNVWVQAAVGLSAADLLFVFFWRSFGILHSFDIY